MGSCFSRPQNGVSPTSPISPDPHNQHFPVFQWNSTETIRVWNDETKERYEAYVESLQGQDLCRGCYDAACYCCPGCRWGKCRCCKICGGPECTCCAIRVNRARPEWTFD